MPRGSTSSLFFLFLLLAQLPVIIGSSSADLSQGLLDVQHPIVYRPASLSVPGSAPFAPSDIRTAYDFLPLYDRGVTGNGTRIAIIDAYGDPTLSSDVSSFDSLTGLPSFSLNTYYPDGVPRRTNSGWALETALDVEWAHAIAPGAKIDLVIALDSTLAHIFDGISYVSSSLTNETTLSMSLGLGESSYPTTGSDTIAATHQLFTTITSHGTTVFASSGDSGASSCCNVEYPASDPLVIAVGGTSLTLDSNATYSTESAWSGSGAGASIIFSKPTWQKGLGDTSRDVADVAYDADPNTGVLVIQGGVEYEVGGTSAGSPQWAALVALASQSTSKRFGSIASKLYNLTGYHDVSTGSDGFFNAQTGWDYPTGLGTPDANMLVLSFLPSTPVSYRNSASFQGTTVTTSLNATFMPSQLLFSGTATATATNSSTGKILFSKTFTIPTTLLKNSTRGLQEIFLLSVPVSQFPLSSNLSVNDDAGKVNVENSITRRIDMNGRGVVDILDAATLAISYGSSLGSSSYNGLADLDANGMINILDAATLAIFFGAPDYI